MNFIKSNLLLLFLCLGNISLFAQVSIPERVLFVGNSYTYFWNLPQTVQAMAIEENINLTTRQSTSGGTHWGHHWRGDRNLKTQTLIKEGDFDAVILQNHSMSTFNRVDSMFHYGQRLSNLAKKENARIYLYMTWAREWNPLMQENITEKYNQLAKRLNAQIVPVGPAWELARQLRPNFPLYDDDGSHPSALGTYLSACVFHGILTGQSPVGLPNRLTSKDEAGEILYLTIQSKESATFCQEVAQVIIDKYKENSTKEKTTATSIPIYHNNKESWKIVYKSNKEGEKIAGDKQQLINAIRQGLPIKVAWGFQGKTHTIEHVSEPIWLGILDGQEVVAHLPPQVLSNTDWTNLSANYSDPNKLKEEWRVVISTKGAFDAVWYDKKSNEQIKRLPQQHPISWMVKGGLGQSATNKPFYKN